MIPASPFLLLLAICLVALGCIAAARLGASVWRGFTRRRGTFAALGALALACTILAQKEDGSIGKISYPFTDIEQRYIYDNGSFVSNNTVHVAFTYQVAPASADFLLYAWPRTSTNEDDMVLVYAATLGTVPQPYEFQFENAISNRWVGITTWTPGPAVHTNGVAVINWQMPHDPAAMNIAAMTRTGVYFNGVKLAPNIRPPQDAEVEYLESTGHDTQVFE